MRSSDFSFLLCRPFGERDLFIGDLLLLPPRLPCFRRLRDALLCRRRLLCFLLREDSRDFDFLLRLPDFLPCLLLLDLRGLLPDRLLCLLSDRRLLLLDLCRLLLDLVEREWPLRAFFSRSFLLGDPFSPRPWLDNAGACLAVLPPVSDVCGDTNALCIRSHAATISGSPACVSSGRAIVPRVMGRGRITKSNSRCSGAPLSEVNFLSACAAEGTPFWRLARFVSSMGCGGAACGLAGLAGLGVLEGRSRSSLRFAVFLRLL